MLHKEYEPYTDNRQVRQEYKCVQDELINSVKYDSKFWINKQVIYANSKQRYLETTQ